MPALFRKRSEQKFLGKKSFFKDIKMLLMFFRTSKICLHANGRHVLGLLWLSSYGGNHLHFLSQTTQCTFQ